MERADIGTGYVVRETASFSLTNTSTETTLFSQMIKGGDFGEARIANFSILCSLTTLLLPPNITVRVKLGGSTLTVINAIALATSLSNTPFKIEGQIANLKSGTNSNPANRTNSQFISAQINQTGNALPILSTTGATMAAADWTLNLDNDLTFSITAQFGVISTAATLARKLATLEIK